DDALYHPAHDGSCYSDDRAAADLPHGWNMGGGTADRLSPDPGLRAWWRMGWCSLDGVRACTRSQEGLLRKLAATWRPDWSRDGHAGLLDRLRQDERRAIHRLGLAPAVPVQHRSGDRRSVGTLHLSGIAGIPEDQRH